MHRVIKKLGFVCKRSLFINHLGSSNGFFQDCGECYVEKKNRLTSGDECSPF